ncbi:MAG: DUF2621 family protein [Proteobacteria bacterium]|nr:DUF2621 family protein [Pseudomonadota bacterium]
MFFGASHLDVQVTSLQHALDFWCDVIGLTETRRGEKFIDVDSGNIKLRLIETTTVTQPVTIRINAGDIHAAHKVLLSAGLQNMLDPAFTADLELVAGVTDTDGNTILVWRDMTEDEYDFLPELPTEETWQADAEALLKQLLTYVPALFRTSARKRSTRAIETLAKYENSAIDRELVIRGYIMSAPKFMRQKILEPLKQEGIDPEDYQDAFDSD